MTDSPRHAGQGAGPDRLGDAGSGRAGGTPGSASEDDRQHSDGSPDKPERVIGRARAPQTETPPTGDAPDEHVVIKDNRKINMMPGEAAAGSADPAPATPKGPAHAADGSGVGAEQSSSAIYMGAAAAAATGLTDNDAVDTDETTEPRTGPLGAELAALRAELDERTGDVQRISAEYANYRKRIDRDRALVVEQATGNVLAALLPVLDDIDRAREHGDLVGPFGVVADQLSAVLTKFGLTPFGTRGDPFDPTRHEAVSHSTSTEVSEPTCVTVMRCGYLLGERLLRPALVAVADPE